MAFDDDKKQRVAKFFGIDASRPEEPVRPISHADPYTEEDPTVGEFVLEHTPTLHDIGHYVYNLFPFIHWLPKYNLTWLMGDLVAGVTVGAVVVPQGMAYADLASLPPEYGLYSSFMGVLLYWFFATSKDITIGPVAVMSQVTGNVVIKAQAELPGVPGHMIASALAVVAGCIIVFLGLARLGWLVEFIPLPAICAFMTGSGLNIAAGQVPKMMGYSDAFETRGRGMHMVVIDTLKHLPDTKLDAALGLSTLFILYVVRFTCAYMAKKQPHRAKLYFFISTLRTSVIILFYTGISAGCNIHRKSNPMFATVGDVPSGFQHAEVPTLNADMIKSFANELPAAIIVMLIEHISISKSFGRINNYTIDPSQELVAIGVTNLMGPFLGAYPATGSFSRTAIKSKAGVRTPFAGVITAVVVLLALYALTAVFWYIPQATLAAVIIHAVCDVITPPRTVYQFWRVAPHEVVIFFAGVLVTVFTNIENGVYTTVCVSFVVLVWRLFLSRGRFLGRARLRTIRSPAGGPSPSSDAEKDPKAFSGEDDDRSNDDAELSLRPGFLPVEHQDGSNSAVVVDNPYPGVFVYSFAEGFNYPNASQYLSHLTSVIFKSTRRTDPSLLGKVGDRAWNDAGPRKADEGVEDNRPTLKSIVLDFSSVNNIDATSVQALIDTRSQLDRYAAPDAVDWHFANVNNRWTKRGLVAAGFGLRKEEDQKSHDIFSIAELMNSHEASTSNDNVRTRPGDNDIEKAPSSEAESTPLNAKKRHFVVQGLNRPLFHVDLHEAVEAAVADAQTKTF